LGCWLIIKKDKRFMSWLIKEKASREDKEEYSDTARSIITVTEHLAYLFAVVMLIIFPLAAILIKGKQGAIVSGISIFLTLPITINILRSVKSVSIPRFFQAFRQLISLKGFQFSLVTLINLAIGLKVGLQTLIPLYTLVSIFLITSVVSFVVYYFLLSRKAIKASLFTSLGLIPLAINLFFLVNFLFGSNPFKQQFHFSKSYQIVKGYGGKGGGLDRTSTILLDDNQYTDYPGMRTFFEYEKLENATFITYTFEEGFFGIRVVTDFTFE
jgi:hypothetical protein